MNRYFFKTIHGRIVGLFIVVMTLMFAVSFYTIRYASQNALETEKRNKLLYVAKYQVQMLVEQDYDSIIAAAGAAGATREEQIAVLNSALRQRTDELATLFPSLGVGYYSLKHDAMLTYGPSDEYGDRVGGAIAPDHPGRIVMSENTPLVRIGSMVRGHIMNAMYPVVRNGEVIGYTWANELTSDIEKEYQDFAQSSVAFLIVFYISSLFIAVALPHSMIRNIDTVIAGVKNMRLDLSARIEKVGGELGEVADNINSMADNIERNAEEHEALLKAEAANAAQRTFLSRMSHEMRTPMNAVIGMSTIAQRTNDIGKIQGCLKKIDDAANHLLGVINDVLDMSKIEAGKMELSETTFSFRQMLNQAITVTGFKIEEKHQNFMLEIGDDVPDYVITDRQRLAQVIANLLSNANKFTPKDGNIWLRVNSLAKEDGVCRLRFEVKDDGIGISKEQQLKLFRSFEQVDNSISRKYGGTGLGLVISKRIIELMHGRVWIESELNAGASFIFEIVVGIGAALKDKAADVTEITAADDLKQESLNGIFADKHILLAEDMEVNRMVVLALFEPTQAKIDCVENGEEAVCRFSKSPEKYDIIFMDIQMPLMDGYEATRNIRSIGTLKAKTIPIIAMTANVFCDDIEKCLAAGMDDHVGKPLDFNEVLKKLRQWL